MSTTAKQRSRSRQNRAPNNEENESDGPRTRPSTRSRPATRSKSSQKESWKNAGSGPISGSNSPRPPSRSPTKQDSRKMSASPTKRKKMSISRPQTKDSVRPTRTSTAASKRSNEAGDETATEENSKDIQAEAEKASPQKKRNPTRNLTNKEKEQEAALCDNLEKKIAILRKDLTDKTIIFEKLSAEVFRMLGLFERVSKMGESRGNEIVEAEQVALHALRTSHVGPHTTYSLQLQLAQQGLTHQQRKELLEKGPFNLVFHGLKPDWIEEEMDDDPEFKRDVLEQKIRSLIRDQCGLMRDVGIVDVYRHKEGAPLRGAYPVVVQFKARREKEQIMWRAKEKLRDTDIVVTEDSQTRLLELMKEEAEKMKKKDQEKRIPVSPTKKAPSTSPSKAAPSSPMKKSTSGLNFSYSSSRPAHLASSPSKSSSKKTPSTFKGSNMKKSQSFNYSPSKPKQSVKTFFNSDDEDEDEDFEFETDRFVDDEDDDQFDDLLDDFPEVPKSPKKIALPDSPQKSLFEDFMM